MEEIEYFRADNVLVTSTRVEINGQTFALRNIGSVKVVKPGIQTLPALGAIVSGLALLGTRDIGWVVLLALFVAWCAWSYKRRRLVLITGGGETMALKGTDGNAIEAVREAIAKAISVR